MKLAWDKIHNEPYKSHGSFGDNGRFVTNIIVHLTGIGKITIMGDNEDGRTVEMRYLNKTKTTSGGHTIAEALCGAIFA